MMLGRRQAGKATGFGLVIRRFESFRPSQFFKEADYAATW